ncbi:hypothetical protein CBR_g41091 [Chara braunii]|uniref:HAT C-terminal dimerisation domain-containing protein n=1 Tax=Chara braunii TaxID=69332 RepID=A0A388LV39_CHABU|nr:hypothetical protein CBR_g41091 [Chara braunii]|eukprot:GBG86187.1 hypothetical protein CBR_g41091 [Chara braunii]
MTAIWSSLQDFHDKYPAPGHWGGPVGDAEIEQPDFDPVRWWRVQGVEHRILRDVAMRCLGAWTTASPCERNWSTHDFVHTKRPNRLGVEQLEKLVFCHWNLKLLQSSHARGGFIGAGLPGVGLTDMERRVEDYSRFEPDVMAPGTYDPTEIEMEVNRLRRQSRGRRLAWAAAALDHKIRQQGDDTTRGEDVIDDDVSWLSGPYRGDGFLDAEAPATVSPAGRMLPPRAPIDDEAPLAGTPAPEADSHNIHGDEFPEVSGGADIDDGIGGDGTGGQVDAATTAPQESHQLREPATRSPTPAALESTLQPSFVGDTVEGTSSECPASAAATFSSPHRAVEYDFEGRLRRRAGFTGPLDLWTASACAEPVGGKAAVGEATSREGGTDREDIAHDLAAAGYLPEAIEQALVGYPGRHGRCMPQQGMRARHGADGVTARVSPLLPLPRPDPSLALGIAGPGLQPPPTMDTQGASGHCSGTGAHDSPGTSLRREATPSDFGARATMPLPPRDPSGIIEPIRSFVGRKRKPESVAGQEVRGAAGSGRGRGRASGVGRCAGKRDMSGRVRERGVGRGRGEGRPRGRPLGRGRRVGRATTRGGGAPRRRALADGRDVHADAAPVTSSSAEFEEGIALRITRRRTGEATTMAALASAATSGSSTSASSSDPDFEGGVEEDEEEAEVDADIAAGGGDRIV